MAFMPRAIARKNKPPASTTAGASGAKSGGTSVARVTEAADSSIAPSMAQVNTQASTEASTSRGATQDAVSDATRQLSKVKLDPHQEQLREQLLSTIESSFSDWGLSTYKSSGLLDRIRSSADGFVHIQHVLQLAPVRALTSTQADVQKALAHRPSLILSPTGFGIGRIDNINIDRLISLEPADWDDMTLYLDNIPSIPASFGSSLASFISAMLSTVVQRIIIPPLYDPQRKDKDSETYDDGSQSEAFARAQAAKTAKPLRTAALKLPAGGGPFRGYAFVVVQSQEDANRILNTWKWERAPVESSGDARTAEDGNDEDVSMMEEGPVKLESLARMYGLRALSYKRWLELKAEYLRYRKSLYVLAEAYAEKNQLQRRQRMRGSPSPPPALEREPLPSAPVTNKTPKRPADSGPENSTKRSSKKAKRASSPSDWSKHVRPPSPEIPLDSEQALEAKGAFPKGCIVWLRNIHEKSTKNSLKTVLSKLLEELEEGSGTGVEFIDYEKGLDNCHVRFASAHLATLMHEHLTSNQCVQLASNYISSPALSSTPPEGVISDPGRRPLISQTLEGERERIYWQQLPESTRRGARKSAGGPVALVSKGKKEIARDLIEARLSEMNGSTEGAEQEQTEVRAKRTKKPSRA
ncbi:hypothetical protein OIV83_004659 [Microbotryomycetes sp. JL201]|nr:hypothetical protein OIV83_004659 [Microbotryomycetes sp. JL201]